MTTLIIELFLFFARYPNKEGILPLFNIGRSDLPVYKELQTKIEALSPHSLVPEIGGYVFGSNFDAVKMRVNNIAGSYLFVDYGEIECDTDSSNRLQDAARLAITVAYKLKNFSSDLIEQAIVSDHCLQQLILIRNDMLHSQCKHPWLKNLSNNHTFAPFVSKELDSIGWTMLFDRKAFDTFGTKKNSR